MRIYKKNDLENRREYLRQPNQQRYLARHPLSMGQLRELIRFEQGHIKVADMELCSPAMVSRYSQRLYERIGAGNSP